MKIDSLNFYKSYILSKDKEKLKKIILGTWPISGDFTKVKPGLYHSFESMEDCVAFELYWAEFNHNDIQRESVGHLKDDKIVRFETKRSKK